MSKLGRRHIRIYTVRPGTPLTRPYLATRGRVPYLPEVLRKLLKTLGVLKASKFLEEEDCRAVRLCSIAFECLLLRYSAALALWEEPAQRRRSRRRRARRARLP